MEDFSVSLKETSEFEQLGRGSDCGLNLLFQVQSDFAGIYLLLGPSLPVSAGII